MTKQYVMSESKSQVHSPSVPEGRGGGWGGSKVLALLWTVQGRGGGGEAALSLIPDSLDSFESVLGKDDPLEALGDSVFSVLEL